MVVIHIDRCARFHVDRTKINLVISENVRPRPPPLSESLTDDENTRSEDFYSPLDPMKKRYKSTLSKLNSTSSHLPSDHNLYIGVGSTRIFC